MNVKISIHSNDNVEGRVRYVGDWDIPDKAIKDLKLFLSDLGNKSLNYLSRTSSMHLNACNYMRQSFHKP